MVAMVVVAVVGYCGLVVVVVVTVFWKGGICDWFRRTCFVPNVLVGVLYLSVYLLVGNDIAFSIGGNGWGVEVMAFGYWW